MKGLSWFFLEIKRSIAKFRTKLQPAVCCLLWNQTIEKFWRWNHLASTLKSSQAFEIIQYFNQIKVLTIHVEVIESVFHFGIDNKIETNVTWQWWHFEQIFDSIFPKCQSHDKMLYFNCDRGDQ